MSPFYELELRPSRCLLTALGVGHSLALLAVAAAGLPAPLSVALLLVIGSTWSFHYGRHALARGPWFIQRLRVRDGRWIVCTGTGEWYPARLLGSFSNPYLILLRLAITPLGVRAVVIASDSGQRESCRQLRLLLAIASRTAAHGDAAI